MTKDDDTFKRTFILVDKKDVLRERQSRSKALTVIGARQLHCVKAVAPGIIKPRRVSCTCLVCLDIEHGVCKNEAYVDEWVEKTLTKDLRQKSRKNMNNTSEKRKAKGEKVVGKGTKQKPNQKKKGQKNQPQLNNHKSQSNARHVESCHDQTDLQHEENHQGPTRVQCEEDHQVKSQMEHEENFQMQASEENHQGISQLLTVNDLSDDMRKTVFQYIFDDLQNASRSSLV